MPCFRRSFAVKIAAVVAGLSGLITPTSNVRNVLFADLTHGERTLKLLTARAAERGFHEDIQHHRRVFYRRVSMTLHFLCHTFRPAGA